MVVENKKLDRQIVLHSSENLHHRHRETAIAVDINNGSTRIAELRSNRGRDTKAHCSESA